MPCGFGEEIARLFLHPPVGIHISQSALCQGYVFEIWRNTVFLKGLFDDRKPAMCQFQVLHGVGMPVTVDQQFTIHSQIPLRLTVVLFTCKIQPLRYLDRITAPDSVFTQLRRAPFEVPDSSILRLPSEVVDANMANYSQTQRKAALGNKTCSWFRRLNSGTVLQGSPYMMLLATGLNLRVSAT